MTIIIDGMLGTREYFTNGDWDQRLTKHTIESYHKGKSIEQIVGSIDWPGWDVEKIEQMII